MIATLTTYLPHKIKFLKDPQASNTPKKKMKVKKNNRNLISSSNNTPLSIHIEEILSAVDDVTIRKTSLPLTHLCLAYSTCQTYAVEGDMTNKKKAIRQNGKPTTITLHLKYLKKQVQYRYMFKFHKTNDINYNKTNLSDI